MVTSEKKKKKAFVRRPPVILCPSQLPMPRAGPGYHYTSPVD